MANESINADQMNHSAAVEPAEILMRRVLNTRKQHDRRKIPALQEGAFFPRPRDVDGLSMFRRQSDLHPDFLTSEQFKRNCPESMARTCGVLGLPAHAVQSLGLTIVPDDDPEVPRVIFTFPK